jgi:putative transposase
VKYAYPVKNMCRWLVVSASGFFDWKRREVSATARRREELTALVVEIFTDSDETYGYRRVHAELGRRRIPAGPELVRSIMRDQVWVPRTLSSHATCTYSWTRPPSRSRRRVRITASERG